MNKNQIQNFPTIEFKKYELSNGLDVILHEDHSKPIVAVNIWYHVGSKNEKRGRTGFAHLFEHIMFEGSQHHNENYFKPLQKIGASLNGSTSPDRTNYWENVPSNYLELALWLESDRMGFLLPAVTQERLDNQRDVVKNERRQMIDNQPYGKSYELIPSMLYPNDHPYSWTVIGSMDDLTSASLEDITEFFRTYYTPNNASLCIAGDFDPVSVKELIEKSFGSIPPGPPVTRLVSWVPEMSGVKRLITEDNINLPRLYCLWNTMPLHTPGDAEINLLAEIMGRGKDSRLYKSLVYEKQVAQDASVWGRSSELAGSFTVVITAREGHSLEELEALLDEELEKLLINGITQEELDRVKINYEARFIRDLEQIGGFSGRADKLNYYNVFLGDPGKFQWDMERYTNVTVDAVQDYAKKYINLNKRAILNVIPQGSLNATTEKADRSAQPKPKEKPSFTTPGIQQAMLSNGLKLLLVEDHKLPLIQANFVIKGGWALDPSDKFTTCSMTAELLDEGTKTRNAVQITEEASRLGADFRTWSSLNGSYVNLNVLRKNFDPALELMMDVLRNPTFPEEELERQRKLYHGNRQQELKQPYSLAQRVFFYNLYGQGHPYSQPPSGIGTNESVNALTRDDLVSFYNANYLSNVSAFVIVGDITLDEAKTKSERALGEWRSGEIILKEVSDPKHPKTPIIYIVDKPDAAQSVIFCGNLGIDRNDSDFLACQLVNSIFGGQFTSRLNMNLREDKGYTYGAHSYFSTPVGKGVFCCNTQVQTEVTKGAVSEIISEIRGIVGSRPIADEELNDSKALMVQNYPQRFQSHGYIANQLSEIFMFNLPNDEWDSYISKINAMDISAVNQAARDHIHPDALLIVVVGDHKKIESGICELGIGDIRFVDAE